MTKRIALNDANRRWWTLGAMCFALFMIMLDNTVVNVALPSIQDDLGFSSSSLAWVVNAYLIAFGGLLLLAGRLGDDFVAGIVLYTGTSTLPFGDKLRAMPVSALWQVPAPDASSR